MLVAFGSARSSPGVTTAVLAVAGCLDGAVLVEGDPDGGVLGARFGLAREPGLTTLAAEVRSGGLSVDVEVHEQSLPGGQPVIVGPASAESAVALWWSAGPRLAAGLAAVATSRMVLVDCGRLSPVAPTSPLIEAADLLVVVARPILEDLHALSGRTGSLRSQASHLAVLMVGDRPYGPSEVAAQLGIEVLGVLAADVRAADALAGRAWTTRGLRRSTLARSARAVAERLALVQPASVSVPEGPVLPTGGLG